MSNSKRLRNHLARPLTQAAPVVAAQFAATVLLGGVLAEPSAAAWPSDPTINVPACIAPNLQHLVVSASDGQGGSFIIWQDARDSPTDTFTDIYTQHLDANGNRFPGWPADGAPVCTTATYAYNPIVVPDGSGGVFVAFKSGQSAPRPGVYLQRLDAQGTPLWRTNGVCVSGTTAFVDGRQPALAPDGVGGAFVAWVDGRLNPGFGSNVFAQHVGSDGAMLWPAVGVGLSNASGIANAPGIIPDGTGGAIAAWEDSRSPNRFQAFARRISSTGVPLWTANGVAVSSSTLNNRFGDARSLAPDGAGGVYVGFEDNENSDPSKAYVQHLTSTGALSPGWPAYGIPLSFNPSPSYWQAAPTAIPDGEGGAVLTFRDSRALGIRSQRVDSAGNLLWGVSGVNVFEGVAGVYHATMSDSAGGFIIGTVYDVEVQAQRLNALGVPQWTSSGVVVSSNPSIKRDLTGVPDGAHGAIFAWTDDRNESGAGYYGGDIYAQNVNADGSLGGTIVATDLALASAQALPDRVRLRWFGGGSATRASLYRSGDGVSWSRLASLVSDGSGFMVYEDRDVAAGRRYAYRLGVIEGATESFTATTWIEVPAALAPAFEGPWPQPTSGTLTLRITVPKSSPARLALHDLQGRTVAKLLDRTLEPGQHTLRFDLGRSRTTPLPDGVYFARVEIAGHVLQRRIVVAR